MTTSEDIEVAIAKAPQNILDGLENGSLTLVQALLAESLGLVDVWDVAPNSWCPCVTDLGRDVRNTLIDRRETGVHDG